MRDFKTMGGIDQHAALLNASSSRDRQTNRFNFRVFWQYQIDVSPFDPPHCHNPVFSAADQFTDDTSKNGCLKASFAVGLSAGS